MSGDYADLRALAEAATPGEWVVDYTPEWEADDVQHPAVIKVAAPLWEADDEPMAVCLVSTDYEDDPVDVLRDAAYIAAANPSRILALLADLDALAEHAEQSVEFEAGLIAERDALAAKVEALTAEVAAAGQVIMPKPATCARCGHVAPWHEDDAGCLPPLDYCSCPGYAIASSERGRHPVTRTPVLSTAAWLATAARCLTTAVADTLRWRNGWWL